MIGMNDFIEKIKDALDMQDADIQPKSGIRDFPNWSSMNALVLIAMFETDFDMTLTGDDLRNCQTVGDLYNLLSRNKQ